ncbi:hypothetical protein GCM10010260_19110 [Streptomyces filipinensis]|uniref:Uncharacterized protein n=1 Tax=Streptomyces filipinensis TaxID=66887 RepID=A0A918I7S3_9ACTN|nr:hypothetical protein GCM10010260_19110 [Streptomyces filipinensis]
MFSAQWAAVRTMFLAGVSITLPVQCQVVPPGPSDPKNVPTSRVPWNRVPCGRPAAAADGPGPAGRARCPSSGAASAIRCAVQNRAACRASCPAEGAGDAAVAACAGAIPPPRAAPHTTATAVRRMRDEDGFLDEINGAPPGLLRVCWNRTRGNGGAALVRREDPPVRAGRSSHRRANV